MFSLGRRSLERGTYGPINMIDWKNCSVGEGLDSVWVGFQSKDWDPSERKRLL